jgi:hypothetical protein
MAVLALPLFFKNRSERCDVLSILLIEYFTKREADALAEATCRDFDSA